MIYKSRNISLELRTGFGGIETVTSSVSQNRFNSACKEGLVYVKKVRIEDIGLWLSERVSSNNTHPNEAYEIDRLLVLLTQNVLRTFWDTPNEGNLYSIMQGNILAENSYTFLLFVEPNFTLTSVDDEDMEVLPTLNTKRGLTRQRRHNFFTRSVVIKLICEPGSITILHEYH
ncbi:unnamed protein product [Nezara viridula]|uniref:Uncharacterized protein n=1 Tax=Nezara viridula TaxID=85310 RepID=A0A9P0H4D8_NEZVI|nr:unnamed protein product [Nezara viridula]